VRLVLNLTPSEKKQLDAAAAQAKLPVATFARWRVFGTVVVADP
jgi:hypothetical protein